MEIIVPFTEHQFCCRGSPQIVDDRVPESNFPAGHHRYSRLSAKKHLTLMGEKNHLAYRIKLHYPAQKTIHRNFSASWLEKKSVPDQFRGMRRYRGQEENQQNRFLNRKQAMICCTQQEHLDKSRYPCQFSINLPVPDPFGTEQHYSAAKGNPGIKSRWPCHVVEKKGGQDDGSAYQVHGSDND